MAKKILIITGGPERKLESFNELSGKCNIDVITTSFYDIEYILSENNHDFILKIKGKDIAEFDLIYIRMVGKRMEDATLVVNYAKDKGIKLVDGVYEKDLFIPSTISKAVEMQKLYSKGINLPKTFFGKLSDIGRMAGALLGYPYVLKSTSGKKARDAWKIEDDNGFEEIFGKLREREKTGVRFFAQEMIRASQRIRALVVGGKVIGAITRPTKWRKSFIKKVNGGYPEGAKEALIPVPKKYSELAIKATHAADLDIAGIDILEEDEKGVLYVIEANAAPSWKLIAKDCGVNVEEEILSFLSSLV